MAALLLVASLAAFGEPPARANPVGAVSGLAGQHTADRVLVRFEPGANREAIAASVAPRGRARLTLPRTEVWLVAEGSVDEVVGQLQGQRGVVYAEPDVLVHAQREPNDQLWSSQWGAKKVKAPEAWETTTGRQEVVIAVLDTGVDSQHEDLASGLLPGRNVVDNLVENLVGQTLRTLLNRDNTDDVHSHGTASASISTARGDNTRGLAGLCWSCAIMPVKVLNDTGTGNLSGLAEGITWAADQGVEVISMSLGSVSSTRTLRQAVSYASERGAVLVAAAGNAGVTQEFYPAALEEVVGVAASDPADGRYVWSNYGDWAAVAAPGCNPAAVPEDLYTPSFCGTSSASPVVAGIAGLAFATNTALTAEQVKGALTRTAVDVGDWVAHGRVDAAATLSALTGTRPAPDDAADRHQQPPTTEGGDGVSQPDDGGGGEDVGQAPDQTPDRQEPPSACPEGEVPDAGFTDTAGNPHEANIDCVAWYGVAQGTGPRTYGPAQGVRRDQMASFIVRLLDTAGVDLPPDRDQGFRDIDGNPHAARINQLAELGIAQGTGPQRYGPAETVRRDQMASFLARAYEHLHGERLAAPPSGFTDIAGNPHASNIEKASAAGFARGTSPTTYGPAQAVRRDQMASFLARTLERGAADGHVTPPSSSQAASSPQDGPAPGVLESDGHVTPPSSSQEASSPEDGPVPGVLKPGGGPIPEGGLRSRIPVGG